MKSAFGLNFRLPSTVQLSRVLENHFGLTADKMGFLSRNFHKIGLLPSICILLLTIVWALVDSELATQKKIFETNALQDVESLSKSYASYLDRAIQQIDQLTLQIKYDWEHSNQTYRLEDLPKNNLTNFRHSAAITIVNRFGEPITSTYRFDNHANWSDSESFIYYKTHASNELRIERPLPGKISGKTIIRLTRRLENAKGEFNGIIIASVAPEYFFSLGNDKSLGENRIEALIGNDRTVIISRSGQASSWIGGDTLMTFPELPMPALVSGGSWFKDDRPRYVATSALESYPYIAVIGIEQQHALSHYFNNRDNYYNLATFITILIVFLAVILTFEALHRVERGYRLKMIRAQYRDSLDDNSHIYFMWQIIRNETKQISDCRILDCNELALTFLELDKGNVLNARLSAMGKLKPIHARLMQAVQATIERGYYEEDMCTQEYHGNNPVWIQLKLILTEEGIAASLRNITERIMHHRELSRIANHDSLTGLLNRHWLVSQLPSMLNTAKKEGHQIGIIFLDLDNFKNINDTRGHSAGDSVLKQVAERLNGMLKVTNPAIRLGGDEFTVILTSTDEHNASEMAAQILESLSQPYKVHNDLVWVTSSIGISLFPQHGEDAETVLRNADIAMYAAKEDGKSQFQIYDEKLSSLITQRLILEEELVHALKNRDFQLYYQPRVACLDGRMVGMEALVRWIHPERGLIAPSVFIPMAERTGMITELGHLVLEEACKQLAMWRSQGLPLYPVSVNVSPYQFEHEKISEFISVLLDKYELEANLIEVEITESVMMGNTDHIRQEVAALNRLGIQIHVDDFGTGFSSLSLLYQFNLNVLKIDRSFIPQLTSTKEGKVFYSTIVSLAKTLKMRVVAEGVETEMEMQMLRDLDCDEVQGYLISRPLPAGQMQSFISRKSRQFIPYTKQHMHVA